MLKIVLFYNQGARGWTETWYANGSAPPLVLNTALKNICASAIAFRSPLTTLEWIRFSVIGSPQKVNSFRMSNKVAAQTNPASRPDVVSTDALWRLTTLTFARRTLSLRGLLDDSVLRNATSGAFEPTAGLVSDVDAYLNKVYSAGWLIQSAQTPINTPGLDQEVVQTLKADILDPTITILSLNGTITGALAGDKLKFSGSIDPKRLPLFPRTPTIRSISGTGPFLYRFAYTMPNSTEYFPGNMKVTKLIYNYETIGDWDFQALTKRDTGRPFGSSRGRRSAAGSRR